MWPKCFLIVIICSPISKNHSRTRLKKAQNFKFENAPLLYVKMYKQSALTDIELICNDNKALWYSRWNLHKHVPALRNRLGRDAEALSTERYSSDEVRVVLDIIENGAIVPAQHTKHLPQAYALAKDWGCTEAVQIITQHLALMPTLDSLILLSREDQNAFRMAIDRLYNGSQLLGDTAITQLINRIIVQMRAIGRQRGRRNR